MTTKPRYRLMIEGAPTEWVTDPSLEATVADGRIRRQGLMYEGLTIDETLDLRESTTRVSGMTIKIVSEYADNEFAYHPDYLAILSGDIDYDDLSMTIDADTGLISVDDILYMGTETLLVTSVSTVTIGITRQYRDSQAQGHYANVDDKEAVVPVYNRVPSYEGRRCFLFRYDEGETSDEANLFDFDPDYQGGTLDTSDELIYRGVISRPPRLDRDGVTWLLDIEPITFLLEQEIANSEYKFSVKGIYLHSMCALVIEYLDYDDSLASWQPQYEVVRGYFPTEEDFLLAVNDALDTVRATFTNAPQSLVLGLDEEGYHLDLKTHATNDSGIGVDIISPILGVTGRSIGAHLDRWYNLSSGVGRFPYTAAAGANLDNDTEYYKRIDHLATINVFGSRLEVTNDGASVEIKGCKVLENIYYDRCILKAPANNVTDVELKAHIEDYSTDATYPNRRLHIDRDPGASLVVGSKVFISTKYNELDLRAVCEVTAKDQDATYDTTYIEVTSFDTNFLESFPVTSESEIYLVSVYGEATNIAGCILGVVDEAVYANKGLTPFLTESDVDDVVLNAITSLPYDWNFAFSSPVTLIDLIREHLKLYNWYMRLSTNGRISFAPFRRITETDGTSAATINSTNIVTPPHGDFPRWEPAIEGVVSVVEISRGYDWVEDSFDDSKKLTIRDVASISTHKNRSRGVTTIEPKGTYVGTGGDISVEEGGERAVAYLALHSTDYDVIEFDVTSDVFDSVLCGSIVSITTPDVPDSRTGLRGLTNRLGYVIARSFDLDPSKGSQGKLTVRMNRDPVYGYAPSLRATANTVYSGSVYTVTVTAAYHGPTGTYDTAFFTVGDLVRVTEFKSGASPNSETGEITAIVSTTSVRIDMDGAFPASTSGQWDIEYQSDSGGLNAGQTNYCYVADASGLLYDDTIGRRFG